MDQACVGLVLLTAVVSSSLADHAETEHPKILWNAKAYPTPSATFPEITAIPAVEFSADGEQVITAGHDGAIKFLNRSNGAVTRTILAHTGAVHSVSVSKDGLLLSSGGADRMLNLWRVSDGTRLWSPSRRGPTKASMAGRQRKLSGAEAHAAG